jgi:hypothetical protein
MAYSNRRPEIALSHKGEIVGYTYEFDDQPDEGDVEEAGADDWDNEPSSFWFQLRGIHFDVREIPEQYHEINESAGDDWIGTIRSALDAGLDLTSLPSSMAERHGLRAYSGCRGRLETFQSVRLETLQGQPGAGVSPTGAELSAQASRQRPLASAPLE